MIQPDNQELNRELAEQLLDEEYDADRHNFLDDDELCMWLVQSWLADRRVLVALDGLTVTLWQPEPRRRDRVRLGSATGRTAREALVKACLRVAREQRHAIAEPVYS